jgi:hypothetical protein
VTIDFHSAVHATVQWDGETIPIERQYWRFAVDQPNLFLFGSFISPRVHWVSISATASTSTTTIPTQDGTDWIVGQVREGSSAAVAIARYEQSNDQFAILVDSSPSYYQFYLFDMTKDRMEGRSWTYLKDDDPSGSGLRFIGHRIASRSFVQTGVGPHSDNTHRSNHDSELLEQMDHERHLLQRQANPQNVQQEATTDLQLHHKLQAAMQVIQGQR